MEGVREDYKVHLHAGPKGENLILIRVERNTALIQSTTGIVSETLREKLYKINLFYDGVGDNFRKRKASYKIKFRSETFKNLNDIKILLPDMKISPLHTRNKQGINKG